MNSPGISARRNYLCSHHQRIMKLKEEKNSFKRNEKKFKLGFGITINFITKIIKKKGKKKLVRKNN